MYDVTVIGPSVIDILAAPFDPEALARGKRDVDQIRMSFGGDALNEAVVLTRLGKKVQLLSKIGAGGTQYPKAFGKSWRFDRESDHTGGLVHICKYCACRCCRREKISDGSPQQSA